MEVWRAFPYGVGSLGVNTTLVQMGRIILSFRSSWKFVLSCREEFLKHVKFKVGDGRRVRFREGPWIGNHILVKRFYSLYKTTESKNVNVCSIRDIKTSNTAGRFLWDFRFSRNLNNREAKQFSDLISLLELVNDQNNIPDKQ
ncbi:hypothetical protein TorRG33x02_321310 [Trema orientale]|uniref:Uncharacterized protein n=1 Tax=Trema orientale TaxID=63057 RepID=A0A2P5BH65_TREOI|nr:hypothetical protein TorRG33x02_321310 [Trema orientale]